MNFEIADLKQKKKYIIDKLFKSIQNWCIINYKNMFFLGNILNIIDFHLFNSNHEKKLEIYRNVFIKNFEEKKNSTKMVKFGIFNP